MSHLIKFFNLNNEILLYVEMSNGMILKTLQKKYFNMCPIITDKFINNNATINFLKPFTTKSGASKNSL